MIIKGQKINERYEIIKLIGEGGMANVYLANDTILERNVAVKVLRGDLADDDKFVRRFQREALAASSLSHPNIVEMYDVGEDDGNFYIVMEYVEGKTLKQLLKKRGKLMLPEVIDIMLQLTDGLAHAHDSYIIHRDIKPQNIMILDSGLVKITDFGIAMALNSAQLTQTNSVMGSVHYLPPEQASGKGSTIKSDIYSLGILMFELLTGKVPFKGENAVEIALKQIKEKVPSIRKYDSDIPQSVENIIIKSTAKNQKNRYNDVREMYQDLKVALNEENKKVKRHVYKYPEADLEETKVLPVVNEKIINDKTDTNIATPIEENEYKKKNYKLFIIIGIVSILLLGGILGTVFWINSNKIKEVKIPTIDSMSVEEVTKELEELGLIVKIETKVSDTVEKDYVISVEPSENSYVKVGSTVTIYKSLGSEKIKIANYVGEDVNAIKIELIKAGLSVEVLTKDVDEASEYYKKTDIIIEQSAKEGEELEPGTQIILYTPNVYEEYPDVVSEGWSVSDVEAFCEEYGLTLKIIERESAEEEGTILEQSPKAESRIIEGITFKIVVAIKPVTTTTTTTTTTQITENAPEVE